MIELKVYCDCGQKYKFDVEPVNGQMPFTVACPICRRDGTTKANELLQQMAVFKQVAPAPSAAPAPIAPPPIGAPPPATVRMRVTMPAPAAAPAPPTADTPPPISARPRLGAAGRAAATATGPAKQARSAVKAIPTGSDAEIRMYIAKQQTEDGQAPKLETISNDQVKQFRETELTNYQALASGQLTKEAYWAKIGFDPKAAKKIVATGENAVSGLVLIIAVLKAGIISMLAGAGLAFKLSANA